MPPGRSFELPTTPSWLCRSGTTRLVAAACLLGLFVTSLLGFLDWRVTAYHVGATAMFTIDAFIGVLTGLLFLKVMLDARSRQRQLLSRLEMIAEMNHHIRNALQTIQLSAHETHDMENVGRINEAVQRIEWALREILPKDHR